MRARKADENAPAAARTSKRSLARRIRIWAQTWRRCPKKGCRRAGRCLRFHDCAGVSKEPYLAEREGQAPLLGPPPRGDPQDRGPPGEIRPRRTRPRPAYAAGAEAHRSAGPARQGGSRLPRTTIRGARPDPA